MAYHEDIVQGQTDGNGNATIRLALSDPYSDDYFLGFLVISVGGGAQSATFSVLSKASNPIAGGSGLQPVVGPILLGPREQKILQVTQAQANQPILGSLVGDRSETLDELLVRPQPTGYGPAVVAGTVFPSATVTGSTDLQGPVQIEGPTRFANQDPWFDVTHPKYGALGNGGDDTLAIKKAALDASANGAILFFPPTTANVYGITASITLYAGVTYRMITGTSLKWVGAAPGADTYMLGTTAVVGQHTFRPRIEHFKLDAGSLGHVIPLQLDSVWQGEFDDVYLLNANGSAGQYGLKLLSSVGNTAANNTTLNLFLNLRIDSCKRLIQFNGNQNGTGVTNNFFYGFSGIAEEAWCDFQQWCDSNYFENYALGAAINATGAMRGLTFSTSAGVDQGVHSERFVNGSIDFNAAGMAGAIGIVFNLCDSIVFENLFSGIGGVGGQVTFEQGTLFQDNGAGNYRIDWINQAFGAGLNLRIIFEKNRRWLTAATDVNGLTLDGAATGLGPVLRAIGTDANIGVRIAGLGTGSVELASQLANHWAALGNAAAGEIVMGATGTDANITAQVNAKGSGLVRLAAHLANFLNAIGATVGNAVQLAAGGADANIPFHITPKGASEVRLAPQLTNFFAAFPANAGQTALLQAQGGDANVDATIQAKGTGMQNLGPAAARLRVDTNGHLVSDSAGTPATSNLGANVTSVTPTGNDSRGKLVIVMGGALAANTRICTVTYAHAYGATPGLVMLTNQTSGAGLGIVNFYHQADAAASFDLVADQALAAGTYECEYLVIG